MCVYVCAWPLRSPSRSRNWSAPLCEPSHWVRKMSPDLLWPLGHPSVSFLQLHLTLLLLHHCVLWDVGMTPSRASFIPPPPFLNPPSTPFVLLLHCNPLLISPSSVATFSIFSLSSHTRGCVETLLAWLLSVTRTDSASTLVESDLYAVTQS